MATEKNLQDYLLKKARKQRIEAHKLESTSGRGWPDLILYRLGRIQFVEVKSPAGTGKLSKAQEARIANMSQHLLRVDVVETFEQADLLLSEWGEV